MRKRPWNERYECYKVRPGTVRPVRYHEPVATIEHPTDTVITITPLAAAKIKQLMADEPDGDTLVLRVAIEGGGCSGFQYGLGFDAGTAEGDIEMVFEGVRVVVDPFSAPYLQGSTVDFLNTIAESGFKIENPNAVASCGCGHSFTVEDGTAAEGGEAAGEAAAGCGSGCSH
jgi:iron-sulfur cluster assembly protein